MAFNAVDEPCYVSADEMVRRAKRAYTSRSATHAHTHAACFLSYQVRIQKDCDVRLRIVGTRNDANEIVRRWCSACALAAVCELTPLARSLAAQFCVGTIKDNFLGLIGEAQ